ncbi:MAG TPA: hypothetical protein VFM06_04790 [Candidatus Limnocylindria bacterium]|nr:hypothetical protein [Candidatus Limnocylindria bacterium]
MIFGFKTGATYTQTQYGSFRWERVQITSGYEIEPARFGDTYIWQNNPYQQLLWSDHWFCVPVSWIQDDSIWMSINNGTTSGTWHQYSTPAEFVGDCYSPTPYTDYLTVIAY